MLTSESDRSMRGVSAEAELDLGILFGALWRHKMWIVLPTLCALVGSYLLVNMLTPKYSAETRLFIENGDSVYARPAGNGGQGADMAPIDAEAISSHVQILYSKDLARGVIRKLNLARLPEFDVMLRGRSPIMVVTAMLGFTRDPAVMTAEERVLETYYDRLSVYPLDRSRVIEVKFSSWDADMAAKIANAVVSEYIDMQSRSKTDRDQHANQGLASKIDDLRQVVAEAEAKVQEFRIRNDLLAGPQAQTLGSQQLGEISTQVSIAEAQRAEAQAKAATIRGLLKANKRIESFDSMNSPLIARLAEQRAAFKAEQAQLGISLLPSHPRMRELRAQVSDIEEQIRDDAEKVARGLENEARVAGARVEAIRQNMGDAKKRNAVMGDQEVTLRALEREAKAQRDLLESWLGLYRESSARISANVRSPDVRIVSGALASNVPTFPKKGPIILVSTLSAALLMMVILFMRELASGRAFVVHEGAVYAHAPSYQMQYSSHPAPDGGGRRTFAEPVALLDDAPSMPENQASVPVKKAQIAAHLTENADDALWHKVMARMTPPHVSRRIVVTGAQDMQAASVFATQLARRLDGQNQRVLVMDMDIKNPSLSTMVPGRHMPGLTDLLLAQTHFGDTIHLDRASGVHVVPVGRSAKQCTPQLLSGARFYTILSAFEAAYDHVIVLAPSILDSDMVADLVSKVDLVFLDASDVSHHVAQACSDALTSLGASELMLVNANQSMAVTAEDQPQAMSRAA